jgi:hypothetical protein
MRLESAAIVIALIVACVGGGLIFLSGRGGSPPRQLSPRDAQKVASFEADLRATTSLDDRLGPTYGDFIRSLNTVIELARSHPNALYPGGRWRRQTLRSVLLDAALRLAPSEPALSAKLMRTVEASP